MHIQQKQHALILWFESLIRSAGETLPKPLRNLLTPLFSLPDRESRGNPEPSSQTNLFKNTVWLFKHCFRDKTGSNTKSIVFPKIHKHSNLSGPASENSLSCTNPANICVSMKTSRNLRRLLEDTAYGRPRAGRTRESERRKTRRRILHHDRCRPWRVSNDPRSPRRTAQTPLTPRCSENWALVRKIRMLDYLSKKWLEINIFTFDCFCCFDHYSYLNYNKLKPKTQNKS